ncbi:MAG TPA: hypothetical protein ENJ20_04085 [Bacteroidetes bacterium]|nr:hypothetical protein [Bacteroidota bacterium]
MRSNFFLSVLMGFSILLLAACGGEPQNTSDNTDGAQKPEPPKVEIKLADFPPSPGYPDAKLELVSYKDGVFNFKVSNYELKAQTSDAPQKMCANSGKGQHIHLIIDNKPYAAKYESSFEYEVPDGEHYVLAFLSRSYHESIKTPDAHVAFKGVFKNNSLESKSPIEGPMLFYSRPKGTYVGRANTDKLMLDFYLINTTLAPDGNQVKALLNGETEFVLDAWKPVFLTGMPMGENKIQLTLIDKEGKKVDAPLNPVERVFKLQADPAEEM